MKRTNAPRGLSRAKIRSMYKAGYCVPAIARLLDCQLNAVMHHLSDLTVPKKNAKSPNHKFNEQQVRRIRSMFINGECSAAALARDYKVADSTILNIVHGVYYRHISGQVINRKGQIEYIPEIGDIKVSQNKKGRLKSGPKPGNFRNENGTLSPIAKKYGVATSTVCRWIKKGKIVFIKTKRGISWKKV